MKYYRKNNRELPILSFKLDIENNLEIDCYTMEDIKYYLCNVNHNLMQYNDIKFYIYNIIEITFHNYSFDYIPDYFCYYYYELKIINNFDLTNIKTIGSFFLSKCYYLNIEIINLPNIEFIGDSFLELFPHSINIIFGNNLKHIGRDFLMSFSIYHSNMWNNDIIFPSNIESIDFNNFMYNMYRIDAYLTLNTNFLNLLKQFLSDNPDFNKTKIFTSKNSTYNRFRIKGLTQDEFNELHQLLPNITSGSYKRRMYYSE